MLKLLTTFLGAVVKPGFTNAWKSAKNLHLDSFAANKTWNGIKWNLALTVPLTLLGPGTPEEKMHSLGIIAGTTYLTMGMTSGWRQFGWGMAFSLIPSLSSLSRGIVQGYRGAIESRTALAVPFSHSSMAMDQAFATLQYSRQRMSDAYSNVGAEAGFFAARYMQR
jgi:hypothetical protein